MEKMERTGRTKLINFRVTENERNDLRALAQAEGITVSKLIARSVDEHVAFENLRNRLSNLDSALLENGVAYDDDRKLSEIGFDSLVGFLNDLGIEDGDQLVKMIELAKSIEK